MTEPERAIEVLTELRDARRACRHRRLRHRLLVARVPKRFPIDTLKVDRSFVMNLTDDTQDRMIFRSTMELAHNLGFEVVAEGVEDRATWDHLVEEGCDTAQGYWIARPQAGDVLTTWLPAKSPKAWQRRIDCGASRRRLAALEQSVHASHAAALRRPARRPALLCCCMCVFRTAA